MSVFLGSGKICQYHQCVRLLIHSLSQSASPARVGIGFVLPDF
ncbi:hypothetical protein HMPREF9371_1962 [Neisseria shayeganii 871]|uniref:Uncharacterized protein n=1 Tax=Neisseria shayeganii 871 TaxID=1032488 RepID=G4CK22_9NEIS|nr:hypothetical protein HMPREF9371_1962 [Neisseria shayeganii 871]